MKSFSVTFSGMPISVNAMTMVWHGKKINTPKYKEFQAKLINLVKEVGKLDGDSFNVWVSVTPGTRRKFDIDNVNKSIYDSFTEAGIWDDDEQVVACISTKNPINKGNPQTTITVWQGEVGKFPHLPKKVDKNIYESEVTGLKLKS